MTQVASVSWAYSIFAQAPATTLWVGAGGPWATPDEPSSSDSYRRRIKLPRLRRHG